MLRTEAQGKSSHSTLAATVSPQARDELLVSVDERTYPLPSANVIFRCFSVDAESGAVALGYGVAAESA